MPAPQLIVHVVYRFAVGGLENGVVNLINRLPADAWSHAIVSLTDVDPAFARRIDRHDVKTVALGKAPGHGFPLYPALYRLFRRDRPAIVHTRNLASLEAAIPAWAARVPVRIHGEHGRDADDPDGRNVRRRWIRRTFRPFVTRYVALSPDLARYLEVSVGLPGDRIEQIFNGVDTERFRPAPARRPIAACPFEEDDAWLVGTVGRMDPVKDQATLAQAFVRAIELDALARRRMRLVMVGDGPMRKNVEAILESAGMRELAWFAGERHDVPEVMRRLDCFVLPSLAEGVSNTVLEAMACGLPVVATRVGANPDLVAEGETGTLVPAGDSEALAAGILATFRDPAAAAARGRAGRARVEQRFSLERMVEHYHALYSELVRSIPQTRPESATNVARGSLRH
jgi:sugar transferase (PEP-CTERM/EpsH1 system associated)